MYKILFTYLFLINLIAFAMYGIDKKKAARKEFRISESALLWMVRLGGAAGAWLGMKVFRHKTKHTRFKIGVPVWMVVWVLLCVALFIVRR